MIVAGVFQYALVAVILRVGFQLVSTNGSVSRYSSHRLIMYIHFVLVITILNSTRQTSVMEIMRRKTKIYEMS